MKRQPQFDLSTDTGMIRLQSYVAEQRLIGKRPVFQQVKEKRSLNQNDMSFAIYKQIAEQSEDMSINDIRARCKLDHGIPILCAYDADFAETWHQIEAATNYEQRIKLMAQMEVTRLMKKPEFSEYLDTIIREYSQQGYYLVHPSEVQQARAAG